MKDNEDALQIVRERRLLIDQYDSWIIEELKPFLGQRIIEIGCGLGNLMGHFVDRELVVGIENSPETVTEVRKRFVMCQNISIFECDITDPSVVNLGKMRFDSAVSLNVFEHIEDDQTAICHTAQLLQPDGYFSLIVPAHQWLYGKMDSSIGHYRRYDKKMAMMKLEKAGLKVVHAKYMNFLGAMGWLVNGRLLGRTVPPSGQLRAFNTIVPVLKWIEHALPPLFGISLMIVSQRK